MTYIKIEIQYTHSRESLKFSLSLSPFISAKFFSLKNALSAWFMNLCLIIALSLGSEPFSGNT